MIKYNVDYLKSDGTSVEYLQIYSYLIITFIARNCKGVVLFLLFFYFYAVIVF